MKRIRIITASFGYKHIQLAIEAPIIYRNYEIDIVFYNDDNTASREYSLHPRLKGKIPKMMEWYEHSDYDYYIWIDSKFVIQEGFLAHLLQFEADESAELFLFKHGLRSSVKEELDYMNKRMREGNQYLKSRYDGELINEQVIKYLSDPGYVDDKIFSGGCLMYTNKLVKNKNYNLMTDWFMHNTLYSIQDQLSLPYLLYKHNVNYRVYPEDMMNNSFMRYDYH